MLVMGSVAMLRESFGISPVLGPAMLARFTPEFLDRSFRHEDRYDLP
jgi:hypothetical protein